jgi:hypothetical protein
VCVCACYDDVCLRWCLTVNIHVWCVCTHRKISDVLFFENAIKEELWIWIYRWMIDDIWSKISFLCFFLKTARIWCSLCICLLLMVFLWVGRPHNMKRVMWRIKDGGTFCSQRALRQCICLLVEDSQPWQKWRRRRKDFLCWCGFPLIIEKSYSSPPSRTTPLNSLLNTHHPLSSVSRVVDARRPRDKTIQSIKSHECNNKKSIDKKRDIKIFGVVIPHYYISSHHHMTHGEVYRQSMVKVRHQSEI